MNYINPKNTKQEIKLWAFYLGDAAVVVIMLMIASFFSKILLLPGSMQLICYVISFILGVYLCVKSSAHPTQRNYQVIWNLIKWDKNKYHSLELD